MDDAGLAWTIVGVIAAIVIGLAGVGVAAVTYLRANPKRRLEWSHESRRLVSRELVPEGKLEILVGERKVPDPHYNEVVIRSSSRADITSAMFDAAKPIAIRVTRGGGIDVVGEARGDIEVRRGGTGIRESSFEVRPQLIRRQAFGSISFISHGEAAVKIDSPLIEVAHRKVASDADRLASDARWDSRMRSTNVFIAGILAGVLVVAMVAVLAQTLRVLG